MTPSAHIINPQVEHAHTHTIIFLHGRDSTNKEFANELFESEATEPAGQPRTLRDLFPTVRWIFPAAPTLRSTRFNTDMSQWFDMWSVENPAEQSEVQHEGLRRSIAAVLDIVASEEAIVKYRPRSIFLAGISQGFAAVVAAFFAGAGGRASLAGLMGLCSWMPLGGKDELMRMIGCGSDSAGALKLSDLSMLPSTPIFLSHSSDDDVVPVQNGRTLRGIIGQSQAVEWHEYEEGGHWINEPEGVDDIASFLRRHM
ncbi:hypothetical protein N0V93_002224 [Gnomoniopsis smithogilvyi]|uniref:Phospholipase/carboxylesterase/thioesterase domain-containing protein n=1 Tax=Gnomoniopsis smithogilvyi TaxID=1191159 RepID=A0A9W8YX60_9PEZI|nr:hypothetical protein N0V93_002224 [Gnomoniopsis smithogilvyi]